MRKLSGQRMERETGQGTGTVLRGAGGVRALLWAGVLAGMTSGCGGAKEAPKGPTAPVMLPMEVEVVRVKTSELNRTVQLPGRLQASRRAEVRSRVEGILEKQFCVEGASVKAGDLLFRIDATRLRADLEVARANLAEKQADAAVAQQTLERVKSLLKNKAVSVQQYDEAIARKGQADAAVAAAQAAVKRAQIDVDYAEVRAPISGRLGRAQVTEGALVAKDGGTLLITIEQTDPIWVNFAQSSGDYLKFRDRMLADFAPGRSKGAPPVDLVLEDYSVYGAKGVLTFSDVVVDTRIGSVGMRASFPNPDGRLLPGQYVGVRFPFQRSESALSVPQRAVQASPQGQFVYRVTAANKVEVAPVQVGGLSGDAWIITAGVQDGDVVVINGVQKIRPGADVKPVER